MTTINERVSQAIKSQLRHKRIKSDEEIFKEQFESYKNGNITDFKIWIGEKGYYFIKWLQAERLSL